MGLIELLVLLALIGFVIYLITTYIPMPQPFKLGIIVLGCLIVLLVIIRVFGLDVHIPRVR